MSSITQHTFVINIKS